MAFHIMYIKFIIGKTQIIFGEQCIPIIIATSPCQIQCMGDLLLFVQITALRYIVVHLKELSSLLSSGYQYYVYK